MKRISALFLLILFCVYAFSFKTHYCYYAHSGERFHGDCKHEIKVAAAKGGLAHANFFQNHYICHDILKNATAQEHKIITIKNPSADTFTFPPVIEIPIPQQQIIDWLIPEFHCRSATLLLTNSLRAPPFC